MTSSQPIIFYDIPANTDVIPTTAWSPNTWKVRFALNYKRIPYKTVWIEYPDIEPTWKKLGIPPSVVAENGKGYYSCPAIIDPTTGAKVTDSVEIVEYLDKQYPDTPKAFPDGTHGLQHAFYDAFEKKITALFPMLIPTSIKKMTPGSQPYLRRAREVYFGKPIDEVYPIGDALVQAWAKLKGEFDVVDGWYDKGKVDGPYLLGKKPGFADFVVAGWILSIKLVFGSNSAEWKDVSAWHNGRWLRLVDELEQYEAIH